MVLILKTYSRVIIPLYDCGRCKFCTIEKRLQYNVPIKMWQYTLTEIQIMNYYYIKIYMQQNIQVNFDKVKRCLHCNIMSYNIGLFNIMIMVLLFRYQY